MSEKKKSISPPNLRISELIDLLKQQQEIADSLSVDFENFNRDEKLAEMWRAYLIKLQEQDELIFKFARKLEISFENDLYRKIVEK